MPLWLLQHGAICSSPPVAQAPWDLQRPTPCPHHPLGSPPGRPPPWMRPSAACAARRATWTCGSRAACRAAIGGTSWAPPSREGPTRQQAHERAPRRPCRCKWRCLQLRTTACIVKSGTQLACCMQEFCPTARAGWHSLLCGAPSTPRLGGRISGLLPPYPWCIVSADRMQMQQIIKQHFSLFHRLQDGHVGWQRPLPHSLSGR